MKLYITTGGGMGGGVKYTNKPDAEFISGTQSTPRDFLRETAALRELRPDIKKPVLHRMLSQPADEPLTMQQWKEVIEKDLRKNGLKGYSYHAVLHHDAKHQNAHILVNMIGFDGQRWNSQNSAKRGMKSCTEIEEEMGLTKTRTLADYRKETGFQNRGISSGALRQFERTGTLPNLTKQAITRRKAAENERNRQNRAACDESAEKRTAAIATDRPTNQTGIKSIRADQEITGAGQSAEQRQGILIRQAGAKHHSTQADQSAAEQAVAKKDFQLKEAAMQKNGGQVQAGQIDDEDTPPTLGGRLRAELRKEAEKRIYDLYFDGRELPTFAYHANDRKLELLATSTPENVAAFFDCCEEKNMKPLRLFGDQQFLRLARAEAEKRGYPLIDDSSSSNSSVISPSLSTATPPASNLFAAVADKSMQSISKHLKL